MFLLRYTENGIEKTHRLKLGLTLIGRLPSCDLVLTDPGVSRHHASVRMDATSCYLHDAGSRFGTTRNGERIKDEIELKSGDVVQIGDIKLTVEQSVPEVELLNEDHHVTEGPGTICRPMTSDDDRPTGGENHLIRLLADIGRTLVSSQSLPDVLNRVVDIAFSAVPAERAFLMLRESADEALSARVLRHRNGTIPPNPTLSRTVVRRVMRERIAILATDAVLDPKLGSTDSIIAHNIRSFMCAPLWNRDDVIGVLYVDSPRSSRFTATDLDAFTALTNAAAVAIEQARLSNQLLQETRRRERLQRYHSPAVVSRILSAEPGDDAMRAQEREVTVMFCDLVGFTSLVEKMAPTEAAALLNGFLTRMTEIIFEHEGTLDKFLGDALLAVFGAPFDEPKHAMRCCQAAVAMRRALPEMNKLHEGKPLEMRIAINTGIALTGDIGSPRRREFTVLGDVVNTASRIEGEVAEPGQIVMSGNTYEQVKGNVKVKPLGPRMLRGRTTPLEMYAVDM